MEWQIFSSAQHRLFPGVSHAHCGVLPSEQQAGGYRQLTKREHLLLLYASIILDLTATPTRVTARIHRLSSVSLFDTVHTIEQSRNRTSRVPEVITTPKSTIHTYPRSGDTICQPLRSPRQTLPNLLLHLCPRPLRRVERP